MKNIFIYTGPHPAHDILADSINCEKIKTNRTGIKSIPFLGRILAANEATKKVPNDTHILLTESISTDLLAGAMCKTMYPTLTLVSLLTDPKLFELKEAPLFDKLLTVWSLSKADILLVGSQMMYDLVPPAFKSKTHIFHPGIKDIKKHLALNAKHGRDFIFVGRLDDYKGTQRIPYLIKAFREPSHNSMIYVAGDGPNRKLLENKILDGIKYLGPTSDSFFMHDVASIYVSPAKFEPSGLAIVEAMAQGLVPIVTEGVGYKEFVRKVDPRLVVKNDMEAELIANTLIKNKSLWNTLSKKCKIAVKDLSYENSVKEFKSILDKNI